MIYVELPFAILEELAKLEKRCSLEEKFGNDTSGTEDVHSFGYSTILLSLNILACAGQLCLLGINFGILACCVEPLWCNIASSTSGGVKVEREIGRVVEWKVSRLVGSEVGDIDPVPGGNEDILTFDIPVRYLAVTCIAESCKDLESDPFLLND